MITTSRFPRARFLMQNGGSRIVSSRNQHTDVTTYPKPRTWGRIIGLACAAMIAAAWLLA